VIAVRSDPLDRPVDGRVPTPVGKDRWIGVTVAGHVVDGRDGSPVGTADDTVCVTTRCTRCHPTAPRPTARAADSYALYRKWLTLTMARGRTAPLWS